MSVPPDFNTYRFGLAHEDIEVVRWMPKHEKGRPILVVPGWGETMESFEYFLKALTEFNRPIFGITHQRDHLPKGSLKQQRLLQEYKANNIIEVLDHLKIKDVDVIGHSEASINVSIAALKRPELFRQLIFIAPVSVTPTSSYWFAIISVIKKLIIDALAALRHKERRRTYVMHFAQGLQYHFSHPIRSTFELISIGKSDIRFELEKISKTHKITVITMDTDILWPVENIKEYLSEINLDFEVVHGWHDELHFRPEIFIDLVRKRIGSS